MKEYKKRYDNISYENLLSISVVSVVFDSFILELW